MDLETQLVDALYKKIGARSFREDVVLPKGEILGGGLIRKRQIRRAVRIGGAPALLDLLIVDPARLGTYGTKKVRDGIREIAAKSHKDGATLSSEISQLLRESKVRKKGA